jgi:hypothetical protein
LVMPVETIQTMAALEQAITEAWDELNRLLDGVGAADSAGAARHEPADRWDGVDHLIHLAAWERSALYFLQGRPRHAALGIDEATYLTGGETAINAAIHAARPATLTWEEARRQLATLHAQLLAALAQLADADLRRPYRDFLPDEPGEGEGPPALQIVLDNTAHHFQEHQAMIEALIAG